MCMECGSREHRDQRTKTAVGRSLPVRPTLLFFYGQTVILFPAPTLWYF